MHGIANKGLTERQEKALKKEAQEFIQELADDFNGNPEKEGFYRTIEVYTMTQLPMFKEDDDASTQTRPGS